MAPTTGYAQFTQYPSFASSLYGAPSYGGASESDTMRDLRMAETRARAAEQREAQLIEKLKIADSDLASRTPAGNDYISYVVDIKV